MKALFEKLKAKKGWEGAGYLALLVLLPVFIGVPIVVWLLSHSD